MQSRGALGSASSTRATGAKLMHGSTGIGVISSTIRGVRKTMIKSEVAAAATMEISAAELRGKYSIRSPISLKGIRFLHAYLPL